MSDVVYALDTAQIMMPDESLVLIRRGEAWSEDSPVVRFKPSLFSDESEPFTKGAPTSIGPDGMPVETATANPGERRSVRRG